jgi:ATP-dependent helicase/nuclease subunit B
LQLLLYLCALMRDVPRILDNPSLRAKPGGVFYFSLSDPILSADREPTPSEAEEKRLRHFLLSGPASAEPEALRAIDQHLGAGRLSSEVISANIKKSGGFYRGAMVADNAAFDALENAALRLAADLCTRMIGGHIAPDPNKKGPKDPCVYCRFTSICRLTRAGF